MVLEAHSFVLLFIILSSCIHTDVCYVGDSQIKASHAQRLLVSSRCPFLSYFDPALIFRTCQTCPERVGRGAATRQLPGGVTLSPTCQQCFDGPLVRIDPSLLKSRPPRPGVTSGAPSGDDEPELRLTPAGSEDPRKMGTSDVLFITLSHSVSFMGENELVVIIGCALIPG